VAHAQRAPQFLALFFNYAQLLIAIAISNLRAGKFGDKYFYSCLRTCGQIYVKLLRLCKKATLYTKNLNFYGKKESSKFACY
jgi:hypothetical protein